IFFRPANVAQVIVAICHTSRPLIDPLLVYISFEVVVLTQNVAMPTSESRLERPCVGLLRHWDIVTRAKLVRSDMFTNAQTMRTRVFARKRTVDYPMLIVLDKFE